MTSRATKTPKANTMKIVKCETEDNESDDPLDHPSNTTTTVNIRKTTTNPIRGMDFEMAVIRPSNGMRIEARQIEDVLFEYCSKWVFQEEIGEKTKRLHWQGRLVLKDKQHRHTSLAKLVNMIGLPIGDCFNYYEPTVRDVKTTSNFDYAMKFDTRVKGTEPYTDKTYAITRYRYIPSHLRFMNRDTMRPYQRSIEDNRHILPSLREIWFISDIAGISGKTWFTEYVELNDGIKLIYLGNPEKVILSLCSELIQRDRHDIHGIIIDIPRVTNLDNNFYLMLETIKCSVFKDTRFTSGKYVIEMPPVYVFANQFPDEQSLTGDRIKTFTINHETWELEPYIKPKNVPKKDDKIFTFDDKGKTYSFTKKSFVKYLEQEEQSEQKPIRVPAKLPKLV
jgi:hypothetical protein